MLADKSLLKKEKDPMRKKILTLCDGFHELEDISKETGIPLDLIIAVVAEYVTKKKVRYKSGYKLRV